MSTPLWLSYQNQYANLAQCASVNVSPQGHVTASELSAGNLNVVFNVHDQTHTVTNQLSELIKNNPNMWVVLDTGNHQLLRANLAIVSSVVITTDGTGRETATLLSQNVQLGIIRDPGEVNRLKRILAAPTTPVPEIDYFLRLSHRRD